MVYIKEELEKLIENPKDEANETDDIKLYRDLLNRIEDKLNAIPDSRIEENGKDKNPPERAEKD